MMATAFFQEDPALKEMQAQLMADLKTAGQEGNTAKVGRRAQRGVERFNLGGAKQGGGGAGF
jgi:hypothetical protein